jgi:hypothetical protein
MTGVIAGILTLKEERKSLRDMIVRQAEEILRLRHDADVIQAQQHQLSQLPRP